MSLTDTYTALGDTVWKGVDATAKQRAAEAWTNAYRDEQQ